MRLRRCMLLTAFVAALVAGCASAPPRETTATGDYLTGRLAARVNALGEAAAAYAEAHRIAPGDVRLLKDAFLFHAASGDIDGARPYAEKLVAGAPRSAGGGLEDLEIEEAEGLARLVLSALALKRGDLRAARAAHARAGEPPFVRSIAFLTDVWIESDLAGPAAAIDKLDNAGARVFTAFSPLHRGLLAEKAGRLDEARVAYAASAYTLGGPVGRAAYGAFLERRRDETAVGYYEALGRDPGPGRRAAEQAAARIERGRPSAAYARTTSAQGTAIAYYSFAGAMIEQAADQRARAEEAGFNVGRPRFNTPLSLARIAIYLDPQIEDARRLVGGILSVYGDYEGAAAVLAPIPPSSPNYEQARIEMAGGLLARKMPSQAAALLRDAIRRDPEGLELRWRLAGIYAGEGMHEAAVETINAALSSPRLGEREAWRYYVSRGGSLLELDRWEEAEADLKKAVELGPEQAVALNYLGYSWAERGINLEEAFELIEKAVSLAPNSGAIIDSLGWAHYQLGDYNEAVGHLEKAASLEPDDPTITDHLGDVYWRLGRPIEARYQWQRALELDPPERLKRALEQKLEHGLDEEAA